MKKMTLGAVLAVVMTGTVYAQGAGTRAESPVRTFAEADVNDDGMLNKREADSALPALGLSDADQDGVITKGDVKSVLPDLEFAEGERDSDPIREPEYLLIVQAMEEMMDSNNQASTR